MHVMSEKRPKKLKDTEFIMIDATKSLMKLRKNIK